MEAEREELEEYVVEIDKLMTSEVVLTSWALNMDLLAVITFDNLIELYRISFKAQRVFQIEQTKHIKQIAFSPDSHLLAYGMIDGIIKIVKTENGERVVVVDTVHQNQIENLNFLPFCTLDPTEFMPFQKNSMQSKLIVNISPHKNCNKNAIIKINYFSEMKENFVLLLSSEKQKTTVLINGFIPIAELNFQPICTSTAKVLYSHHDQKIFSIVAEEKMDKYVLHLIEFEAKELNEMQSEIIKYNCLLTYVTEIINFVQVGYEAGEVLVRDILRQYHSKINLIDDSNIENINPCEELFRYLNCGITSPALMNFFTKEVHDSKILQKLDEAVNASFAQLHDLLLESIQNSLEKATILLKKLISLSKISKFSLFGIDPFELNKIEEKICRLYTMGEVLLIESTEAKFDIRNLLVWLNKATIKSSAETEAQIQNVNSYLNRYTVDFNRLHAFLAHQNQFKLNHLLNFFCKTNEWHSMKVADAEFRVFSKHQDQRLKNDELMRNQSKLEKLLEVEDMSLEGGEKMCLEYSYKSFKFEVKELLDEWKALVGIPVKKISSLICKQFEKTTIGEVEITELFEFEIKTILRDGQLFLYYVERLNDCDFLIEYNCHQHSKKHLKSTSDHIVNIAVANDILAVVENKYTTKKQVIQISNQEFNGSEIQIGLKISKIAAGDQLDINTSLRGLNSLVLNKTKLIIFMPPQQ